MVYGLIISAGKQSRFESDTPKALMPYGNCTLLDINIANMMVTCDEVYVVVSTDNQNWFNGYHKLVIESGNGCGDAVMRALAQLDLNDDDTVFIQWGDCFHTLHIYQDLRNRYVDTWLIPCVKEEKPYVQIKPHGLNQVTVNFSKYNEPITSGYHDLSLFYGNALEMLHYLQQFANNHLSATSDSLYQHKHGNELQFLDVFNETLIRAQIIELLDYEDNSFNTVAQFQKLMQKKTLR